ncbi:MAG: hypothetical protein BroJett011_52120 [Chloroflexota bacterium]|nr:MAG: hypothetical protein BroJett011_52120 [Chloroflexota bacterium]
MPKKLILIPLIASVALVALVAVSLAVFAFAVDPATAQSEEAVTIEAAPVHVQPAVIESQVRYEGYSGGCSHSTKMMMTDKSDQKTLETPSDQLLTQAIR